MLFCQTSEINIIFWKLRACHVAVTEVVIWNKKLHHLKVRYHRLAC